MTYVGAGGWCSQWMAGAGWWAQLVALPCATVGLFCWLRVSGAGGPLLRCCLLVTFPSLFFVFFVFSSALLVAATQTPNTAVGKVTLKTVGQCEAAPQAVSSPRVRGAGP